VIAVGRLTEICEAYIDYTIAVGRDLTDPICIYFENEIEEQVRESKSLDEIKEAQNAIAMVREEKFKVKRK
jgi:hypothetical protein